MIIVCGIAGSKDREKVLEILKEQEHRGNSSNVSGDSFHMGHVLHSVVGDLEQPIEKEGLLTANCEIYNWKELAEKHGLRPENDAELLLYLLEKEGLTVLEELDGIYSFGYLKKDEIVLARDRLGVNPLWYTEKPFTFASEKKALESQGLEAKELHPRQIIRYNISSGELSFESRDFFEINEKKKEIDQVAEEIKEKFLNAVEKRIPEKEVALLFSGGLDSTMIAAALKELGKDFTCYTSGIQYGNVNSPRDVEWAEKVAEDMGLELNVYNAELGEVEQALPDIVEWISSTSTVKTGVALPFHFGLKGDEKVVMSGLGSEQLYAGYSRHQGYLNKECLSGLRSIYHRDLYRDNVVSFRNGYELRVPFLDEDLIRHALTVPEDYKVREGYRKYVLRLTAKKLNVPEEVVWRKKTAAQYGSNFDKALNKLSKENGFGHKQQYLNSLRDRPNKKLAVLTSGGKDSNTALYRMKRRNNEISCLVTLRSENEESYMFDSKKDRDELERQANTLGIPLIVQETQGEKEKELKDLGKAMQKAKEEFDVEGIVTGALASTYQRDRVENLAERQGLKVFSPLWQENQENYMRWLVKEGFKVEVTSVAARGLEASWEGKVLDEKSVEEIIKLSKKYGFNAAGEGGEYETRVKEFPDSLIK